MGEIVSAKLKDYNYVGPQRKAVLSSHERERGTNVASGVYSDSGSGLPEIWACLQASKGPFYNNPRQGTRL